jgi:DNA mismatch repair protein MutL
MNRIKVLSDNLANQIAAGEVVERPASVVKELVENSIDAGAKRIQIDIELGGRRLMRISDDGSGMTGDDALLSFERHATSKIADANDLAAIRTLGFRGEALASIASVARVEMTTKTEADDEAVRIVIEGGKIIEAGAAARPTGTTIVVRDLFFNTPARRKFMRAEATENFHLTQIVQHYGLAYPEIAFTLTNNGRDVLRLSAARDLRERAYQIFGSGLIESLLPVDGGSEHIAIVRGFVSAPRERRTNRDGQYFFVNRRFVRDKTIAGGLLEGFRAVLPHGIYPVAFLLLEVPLEEIDVNVHPAKTEIRFRRSEAVKEVIASAVKDALAGAGIARQSLPVRHIENEIAAESFAAPVREIPVQTAFEFPASEAFESAAAAAEEQSYEIPPATFHSGSDEPDDDFFHVPFGDESGGDETAEPLVGEKAPADLVPPARDFAVPVIPPVDSAAKAVRTAEVGDIAASKIGIVGQLHNSFIIAVDDEGLLLIDQHVAHERILFDKFRRRENERAVESQNLLLAETIDLSPAQLAAFEIAEPELELLGFDVRKLSGRTVAVKCVPADIPQKNIRNLVLELLETVDPVRRGSANAAIRDDIAASLACKAAVKINMPLTKEKMQWLVDRLLFTTSPTTCPHGRPVILRLTMKDIERGFHRT